MTAENWIVLNGDKYENGAKVEATTPAPETTAAPEETKAPETTEAPAQTAAPADTEPAKSGCGSFVAGGVAILAILGTALVIKKRD